MNIGFIGTGHMGGAIVRALSHKGGFEMYGVNRTRAALEALARETGLTPCADVRELVEKSDCIVLAVKPQQAHEVWPEIVPALTGGKCLVSLAAGLTTASLKAAVNGVCPVVRTMPNIPVLIREGVCAVCFDDESLAEGHKAFVLDVFATLGDVHVLPEAQFDAFTAVIGSGPAFIFYLIESMIEAGFELGLEREAVSRMVKKLFSGSSIMAEQSAEHITLLKETAVAPAGTTIAALAHFDRTAVRGNIIDAVRTAYERSVELG